MFALLLAVLCLAPPPDQGVVITHPLTPNPQPGEVVILGWSLGKRREVGTHVGGNTTNPRLRHHMSHFSTPPPRVSGDKNKSPEEGNRPEPTTRNGLLKA